MTVFTKGQKSKISDLTTDKKLKLVIKTDWNQPSEIDFSCFGLDQAGKLSDDNYFVFYNQKKSPEGAIELTDHSKKHSEFVVDLEKLPTKIQRLTFALSVDGNDFISKLSQSSINIYDSKADEVLSFPFSGSDFADEKAVMLFDVYFKDQWRFGAVCQGFNQGLRALLEHFGGVVSDKTTEKPKEKAPDKPAEEPSVSLSKVTLEKRGDTKKVDLGKKSGGTTSFHINLNWDQIKKGGFFNKQTADLDLGCMFEMQDGKKGVIQALGGYMGAPKDWPWIYLDKDDRSGASQDGENLYILKPQLIKRVLVFAFIYEGDFFFTEVNARILIKEPNGDEIAIRLNNPDKSYKHCAICLFHNQNGTISVSKEERYMASHIEIDKGYNFGFRWVAGRK
ncbi:MAG: TerD family protein [Deltaproteobacteria bacterium]|jgi:tellurite resistance protein TerA|nr:TerD family protein [Deltaproteobacteria bacterium]